MYIYIYIYIHTLRKTGIMHRMDAKHLLSFSRFLQPIAYATDEILYAEVCIYRYIYIYIYINRYIHIYVFIHRGGIVGKMMLMDI
jgi:hypothetical protein